jgi:hypothetical protein
MAWCESRVEDTVVPASGTWNTGATVDNGGTTTGGSKLSFFWKLAESASPTRTFNLSSGDHIMCVLHTIVTGTFYAADPVSNQATNSQTTDTTARSISGTTSTQHDCIVSAVMTGYVDGITAGNRCSGWTNANLADITERFDRRYGGGDGGTTCSVTGTFTGDINWGATTVTDATSESGGNMSVAVCERPRRRIIVVP